MKIFLCINDTKLVITLKSLGFIVFQAQDDIIKNIAKIKESEIFITDTIDNLFWINYSITDQTKRYIFVIGLDSVYPGVMKFETLNDLLGHMVEISPLNITGSLDKLKELNEELDALKILCKNLLFHIYDNSENSCIKIIREFTEKLANRVGVSVTTDENSITLQYSSKRIDKCY